MNQFRVGILGCGGIGHYHAEALAALPDRFKIVAACDPVAANAAKVAAAFNIPSQSGDFASLLGRPDIDIVHICTPSSMHTEQAVAVLKSGKHVVVEKPIAGSLADADALIAAERASGRSAMPIFQNRFTSGYAQALAVRRAGLLGRHVVSNIETAWLRYGSYYDVAWRGKWATELGGCLTTHAIHAHDLLCFLVGRPKRVFARTQTRLNPIETEDLALLALEFEDGSFASSTTTLASTIETSRFRYVFEHATIEGIVDEKTGESAPWIFKARKKANQPAIDAAVASVPAAPQWFEGAFAAFHDALVGGSPPPVTLADARLSIELLTAAYESAASHSDVLMPISPAHPAYRGWRNPSRVSQ